MNPTLFRWNLNSCARHHLPKQTDGTTLIRTNKLQLFKSEEPIMARRSVTNYPLECKQSSAKLAAESEQSISSTARELGVTELTHYAFLKLVRKQNRLFLNI